MSVAYKCYDSNVSDTFPPFSPKLMLPNFQNGGSLSSLKFHFTAKLNNLQRFLLEVALSVNLSELTKKKEICFLQTFLSFCKFAIVRLLHVFLTSLPITYKTRRQNYG